MEDFTELTRKQENRHRNKKKEKDFLESREKYLMCPYRNEWAPILFSLKKILFQSHVGRKKHMTVFAWITYTFPGKGKTEGLEQQHDQYIQ